MPVVNERKTFTLEGEIYVKEADREYYAKNTESKPVRVLKRFRLYDEDEPFIVTSYEKFESQGEANEKPENLEDATVPKKPKLNN